MPLAAVSLGLLHIRHASGGGCGGRVGFRKLLPFSRNRPMLGSILMYYCIYSFAGPCSTYFLVAINHGGYFLGNGTEHKLC
jgi:hypothetical protein